MSTVQIDSYSDQDMQCPADWENGFKEGRVPEWGTSEFTLSHPWSGEWQGSRYTYTKSDYDSRFRTQFASPSDRYWVRPYTMRITSRENRAAKGVPYTVFHGPVVNVQFPEKGLIEITLGDIVSEVILQAQSDKFRIPWRVIGDGPLDQFDAISDALDPDTPEPIIYGTHNRTLTSLATPAGFRIVPIYLGIWTVGGTQRHVWLLSGHACASVNLQIDGVDTPEGSDWLIPGHAGWNAVFGAPYVDLRSQTYGNDRRYAFILGEVGASDPDDVVLGDKVLTCDVEGVEDAGDGGGTFLTDIYDQRKHFDINFVANRGPASYQSGAWLANPTHDIFGVAVSIIDAATYDAAKAIGIARKPDSTGIQGAAVIGRGAGDRYNAPKWDADWNRSSAARAGWTNLGQKRLVMLSPTAAIKAAAPLLSDALHIIKDSFRTSVRWGDHANMVPFRTDHDPTSGVWRTSGVRQDDVSIQNYERGIPSETREYPFAPGLANGSHLADLEVRIRAQPPRGIEVDTTVSPPPTEGPSLTALMVGDYFRYLHFDAVGGRTERLAQIEKCGIRVSDVTPYAEAIDCEDLIDYDVNLPGDPDLDSALCTLATDIDLAPGQGQTWIVDTTSHPTDDSVQGLFPGPGIAYHAAWWTFTAPDDGALIVHTFNSNYDTQLVAFTGPCSALDFLDYNDNYLISRRSLLAIPVFAGETYKILVCGYGPADGGDLTFTAGFLAP